MIVKHFGSAKDFRSHSANFLHRAKSLHDHQRDPVTNEAQVKIVNENTSEKEVCIGVDPRGKHHPRPAPPPDTNRQNQIQTARTKKPQLKSLTRKTTDP
jgi:hypothetical protein